jgi:hypothetical protein
MSEVQLIDKSAKLNLAANGAYYEGNGVRASKIRKVELDTEGNELTQAQKDEGIQPSKTVFERHFFVRNDKNEEVLYTSQQDDPKLLQISTGAVTIQRGGEFGDNPLLKINANNYLLESQQGEQKFTFQKMGTDGKPVATEPNQTPPAPVSSHVKTPKVASAVSDPSDKFTWGGRTVSKKAVMADRNIKEAKETEKEAAEKLAKLEELQNKIPKENAGKASGRGIIYRPSDAEVATARQELKVASSTAQNLTASNGSSVVSPLFDRNVDLKAATTSNLFGAAPPTNTFLQSGSLFSAVPNAEAAKAGDLFGSVSNA